jgi:neutral ceramidase
LFAGDYDPRVADHITQAILKALEGAQRQLTPVKIGYVETDATGLLYNRLTNGNPVDGLLRLIKLEKTTGESALLCTFAGHATLYNAHAYQYLSRDYPGALVDRLEKASGHFVAFMAGAVGSTGPQAVKEPTDLATINRYADTLTTRIAPLLPRLQTHSDSTLAMLSLPLGLREPSPRVIGNWRVRPWLFYSLYGDYPSDLKALRIGRTVLVGTPCDFSGELVAPLQALAARKRLNLLVTSFNGGYVGYITPDQYYDKQAYETYTMNWFGPYNGAYFVEMMRGLVEKL